MARVPRGRLLLVGLLSSLLSCGRVGIQLTDDAGADAAGPDEGGMVGADVGVPSDDAGADGSGLLADASAESGVDGALSDAASSGADVVVPCADTDRDGVCDSVDGCPADATMTNPGVCGCSGTPPAGLVGYWALDEASGTSARDVVANRDGALRNFAATPWTTGRHGNALSFDGTDDYVDIGSVTTNLRAIAFWVRPTSFAPITTDTGWLSPTANGDPNNGWMDATNVYVSDDNYANGGILNDINHDFHGFGIQIPASATVQGIEAEVEMKTGNPTGTFGIELSWNRGGNYTSTGRQAPLTTSDQYWPFGGATDLWGSHIWLPAEMGDATFRVALSKQGINFSPMTPGVDHLRVRVHHTAVPLNRVILDLGGGPRVELSASTIALSGFPNGSVIYVDNVASATLDSNWHHVVVTTLNNVVVTGFTLGRAAGDPHYFNGLVDDVKLLTVVPSAADRTMLMLNPNCR